MTEQKTLAPALADVAALVRYYVKCFDSILTGLEDDLAKAKSENNLLQVEELQARIEALQSSRLKSVAELEQAVAGSESNERKKPARKKKNPNVLSRADLKLIDASTQIMTQLDGEDMAFSHSVLCQVGLPRKEVAGREFMRQSGDAWVNVQAGWLDEGHGPVLQPVPYGALPRLALAWISTQAVRTKSREIQIGDTASAFLQLLGKTGTGGKNGTYKTLRIQMNALAACRLQLGFKGRTYNGQPVEQFDAWIADEGTGQKSLWPGVLVLSEGYFSSLQQVAVPLDYRALLSLSGSALGLDVYCWLAHRLHTIEGSRVLRWSVLKDQFGQEYTGKNGADSFKTEFLRQLKKVLAVYPRAVVRQVPGGLELFSSPPPIPYKGG